MKNKQHVLDIAMIVVLAILLVLFINPAGFFMPTMFEMGITTLFVVVFCGYAVFFWREAATDEREQLHRLFAARTGFICGAGVLTIGITISSFMGYVNPWLVLALGGMIVGKVIGGAYGRWRL